MNSIVGAAKRVYWKYRYNYARSLSRLGERFGIDAWTYNPAVMDLFGHIATEAAPVLARRVCDLVPEARSVVDLGCGTGHFVHAFAQRGLTAYGFERSVHGRAYASRHLALSLSDFDLTHERISIPKVDIAMSLEVVEHLPEVLGDKMVALLTEAAPVVVFSGAHPGQGGQGHINEQPKEYWIRRFQRNGFALDESASRSLCSDLNMNARLAPWLSTNTMVLRRVPMTTS
jgi:hypothetical protein